MITLVETLNVKTGCKNLKLCTMTWGDPTPDHQSVHYTQIYYNPGQIYYNTGENPMNRALSSRVIPP